MRSSFLLLVAFLLTCAACNTGSKKETKVFEGKKTGVLLVNHGSRSATWRKALMDLETEVKDSILKDGKVQGIKTAFMEYNEPSIATRLKEFDQEGYSDIIIVPVFLTVSTHSFDDIPTVAGQKDDAQVMEQLKIEKIERYKPQAKVHITPLLDFTEVLQKNVLRRYKAISKDSSNEALVMIAYGDETYDKEWTALMNSVGTYVKEHAGVQNYTYGWCGHIVRYSLDSTTAAINKALQYKPKAVVIPILVAHDENFQIRIIGGGIDKVANKDQKVIYKPDAILPDDDVKQWVINISQEYANKLL